MKTLYLPLKAQWYEMIESGVKTEEYRGITAYWIKRFFVYADGRRINNSDAKYLARNISVLYSALYEGTIKHINYTHVKFSYGYTKRIMIYEIDGFTFGKGKHEWGAPKEDVFIIKIGKESMTYKIGDEVWFLFDGNPLNGKIARISEYTIKVKVIFKDGKEYLFSRDIKDFKLFPSKEELLKSLKH